MHTFLKNSALLFLFAFSGIASGADQPRHPSGHRYLSNPEADLKPHYEFLVVGSGYGASIAALRIAQAMSSAAGEPQPGRLAVFERGREWMPGEYPQDFSDIVRNIRADSNPLGWVDLHSNVLHADADIIGANDLGGGSNINAAIVKRPTRQVLELPDWPKAFRDDVANGSFESDFQKAEAMLLPVHGPRTRLMPKTKAHLASIPLGVPTGYLALAVNHEPGRTRFGVSQNACTNCGNCCGGCNVGAKNTLKANYLPCAKDEGAEIFTRTEIEYVERLPQGSGAKWKVHYKLHRADESGKVIETVRGAGTANHVFLGAGSAGSTEILLRSRKYGALGLSPMLGARFSANGDVLGFVYNGKVLTSIVAAEDTRSLTESARPVGQTITAFGDWAAANKDGLPDHQLLMLDGALPKAFAKAVAQALAAAYALPSLASFSLSDKARIAKDLMSLAAHGYPAPQGALNHSMLLLVCGHDSASGRYILDDQDRAYVKWPGMRDEESFRYTNRLMENIAKRLGGTFIPNPRSQFAGGGKMQVTHPLGGCPTGEDFHSGVVNHRGQVFSPDGGVYDGLYVVDAAVVPRSLGAPPISLITAWAERAMRYFVDSDFKGCGAVLNP